MGLQFLLPSHKASLCFVLSGESSPTRREAVKRRTAEYLMRAESICSLRAAPQLHTGPQVWGAASVLFAFWFVFVPIFSFIYN